MIKRDDCEYLTLDAMPFVVGPDKRNWVFARTTKKWEPYGNDDWDAVYPNWDSWWEDMFAELPELPEGVISQEFVMAQKPPSSSDTASSSGAQKTAAPTTKSAPTLNPSTKPPYDLTRYPNLVDRTSQRRGRGYVIGGAPSAKLRGKIRDKTGKIIPDDAFENEPGPMRDPKKTVSAEDLAKFDKDTEAGRNSFATGGPLRRRHQ